MGRPATCCALWLCCFASLFVARARAQAMLDYALEIEAPKDASCTQAPTLQRAIEARVGSLVFLGNAEPSRRIGVSVTRDDAADAWGADIIIRDERGDAVGERRVTARSAACSALDEALVVVISTLIGIADGGPPSAAKKAEAPVPPDEPPAEEGPRAPRPEQRSAAPTFVSTPEDAPRSSELALALSAGGLAELGLLPGLAVGAALALDVDLGTWSLVIGATGLPYARQDLGDSASATFATALADAALCLNAVRLRRGALALCAGAQAGVIGVRSSGVAGRVNRLDPLVRGRLGPRLRAPLLDNLGLFVGVAGALPIESPRYFLYDIDGRRYYHHVMGLGISAEVGICWLFGS